MYNQVYQRLNKFFTTEGVDALILVSPANLSYLCNIELPFSEFFPDRPVVGVFSADAGSAASSTLICPHEWAEAVEAQGFESDVITYSNAEADVNEYIGQTVRRVLEEQQLGKGTIACELDALPTAMMESLGEKLPGAAFVGKDRELETPKRKKEGYEVELLTEAARQLEFGFIGALQHLEGSQDEEVYTLSEFCERIRVHVYENGGTAGGLASAAAGDGLTRYYSLPQGTFKMGELVRVESSSRYRGYWAVSSRMISIGEASESQKSRFAENLRLKNLAVKMIEPGMKVADLFKSVEQTALREGLDFRPEFGVGHGIGTAEREAPYLYEGDETVLQPGMCVVIGIYTEGPKKELICSKDTYLVRENEALCISSYHDWNRLYEVVGFQSAH